MSWILLASALVSLAFSVNVHAPIRRPAPLAALSFLAGWLTSELVGHALLVQVAIALLCIGLGGLGAWPGWVALGVLVVSWVLLARSHQSSRRAAGVVDEALRVGLMESAAPESLSSDRPLAFGVGQLAIPFRVKHPDVERVRDIVYVEGERHRLRLDVYRHRSKPRGCPVILQIHGGGWVMGSKDQQGLPLVTHLASRKWLCVSANYRLSPRATFPDPLVDLKFALKWIREHAEEYGGDPSFVVVTGGSAGGHLASLLALTANQPEYQPGFEEVDTSVRACVAFYGVYDFTDRFRIWPHKGLQRLLERAVLKKSFEEARPQFEKASPMGLAHHLAPPFLVVHGDCDSLVPVEEARHFVRELREKSKAPVVYVEVPGAQHAFEVWPSVRTALVLGGVERFLRVVRAEARLGPALVPAPSKELNTINSCDVQDDGVSDRPGKEVAAAGMADLPEA